MSGSMVDGYLVCHSYLNTSVAVPSFGMVSDMYVMLAVGKVDRKGQLSSTPNVPPMVQW